MHKKEHQQIVRAPAASGLLTHETANLQVLHQPCHDRAPHCQDVCQANKKVCAQKCGSKGTSWAPSAVASQKFPAPTAQLPRNMTISPFHSRPAAPSATSARETFQGWKPVPSSLSSTIRVGQHESLSTLTT